MKTLIDILRQLNIELLDDREQILTELELYRMQYHSGAGIIPSVAKTTLLQRLEYCKAKGSKIKILRACNRMHRNSTFIK
jgi:hypothetical protein